MNDSMICKTCGAHLSFASAIDGVLKCEYCGNLWTVPKKETVKEALGFLQIGEHDLDTCKFDDAFLAYAKAAELDGNEPEAYFGMALAEFKVQYIKDEVNKRVQPICHINSEKVIESKKFSDNKHYQKALELATPAQRTEYSKKAKEIDYIRDEFLRLRESGQDYDCFICVKVTELGYEDENGERKTKYRTSDYKIADDIYYDLRGRGYKPFFSEREIGDRTGADYEAYILYALYCSECMLVVCSNEEYLKTKWVKNEYTRFMSMIADDRKERDSLTIVFKGDPIENLPGKPGKIQGIKYDSFDAVIRIREFVDNHSPEGKKRREAEKIRKAEAEKQKAEAEKKLREEQEALRKQFEEQNRMFEERLRNMKASEAAPTANAATATVNSLLTRANQFLEYGDTKNAEAYYERALDAAPECGEAWWGKFLLEFGVKSGDNLIKSLDWQLADRITASRNYTNAIKYASGPFAETAKKFNGTLTSPATWWNKFLSEMGGSEDKIIREVNSATLKSINKSRTFEKAKKLADEEYKTKIKNFEAALDAAPAHWNLFLEDMGVKNESELLSDIVDKTRIKIENDPHYSLAAKRAEGEFRTRLDAFQSRLYSGELWWNRFIQDMKVPDTDRLLGEITDSKKAQIEKNEFYLNAVKYASGESKEKIDRFNNALYSGELWWKRFLEEMKAKNENEILALDNGKVLNGVAKDKYFLNAKSYATGELAERIERFEKGFEDYELWKRCFLREYKSTSYDALYDSLDDVKKMYDITKDEYFNKAYKFANAGQKKEADEFIAKLDVLKEHYKKGQEYWRKLIEEFGCKGEKGLLEIDDPITDSENYTKALEETQLSRDAKTYAHMVGFAEKQVKEAEENANETSLAMSNFRRLKRRSTYFKLRAVIRIIFILAVPAIVLTNILGWAGVEPFSQFWVIFAANLTGRFVYQLITVLVIIVGLIVFAFNIKRLQVSFKSLSGKVTYDREAMKDRNPSSSGKKFKLYHGRYSFLNFSLPKWLCIIFVALTIIPAAVITYNIHHNTDKYLVTDQYIAEFFEVEDGYSLMYFHVKEKDAEIVFPDTFNGKPIVALSNAEYIDEIDSETDVEGFRILTGKNKLKSITLGSEVRIIGDSAFEKCKKLESVVMGDKVEIIGDSAFGECEVLRSAYLGKSIKSIGNGAFWYCEKLEEVVIPDTCVELGEDVFFACWSLKSITMGPNVTKLKYDVFGSCSHLEAIYFHGTEAQWKAIPKESGYAGKAGEYTEAGTFTVYYSESDEQN